MAADVNPAFIDTVENHVRSTPATHRCSSTLPKMLNTLAVADKPDQAFNALIRELMPRPMSDL